MTEIGFISLKNKGGFVVRLEFEYFNEGTNKWIRTGGTGDITLGFSAKANPGDYGVPDGCLVRLHANVVWGTDKVSNEMFSYKRSNGGIASYSISGTTLSSHLEFHGISAISVGEGLDSVSLEQANILLDYSNLSDEQLNQIKADLESAPLAQSGSYGPLSWDISFHFDPIDIKKSRADVQIYAYGVNIIAAQLDVQNPKITVDKSIAGVGVIVELGLDFNSRKIYLKGNLNFVIYTKSFDLTILSF